MPNRSLVYWAVNIGVVEFVLNMERGIKRCRLLAKASTLQCSTRNTRGATWQDVRHYTQDERIDVDKRAG